jgi:hypothetical protein
MEKFPLISSSIAKKVAVIRWKNAALINGSGRSKIIRNEAMIKEEKRETCAPLAGAHEKRLFTYRP